MTKEKQAAAVIGQRAYNRLIADRTQQEFPKVDVQRIDVDILMSNPSAWADRLREMISIVYVTGPGDNCLAWFEHFASEYRLDVQYHRSENLRSFLTNVFRGISKHQSGRK